MKKIKVNQVGFFWLDKWLLNPQKNRYFIQVIIILIIALIVLLTINEFSWKNTRAYFPVLITSISLTGILMIVVFIGFFLKIKRFQRFNNGNYEEQLITNIQRNAEVLTFSLLSEPKFEIVNFTSSWMERFYEPSTGSGWFFLQFQEQTLNITYGHIDFTSSFAKKTLYDQANVKKIIIAKGSSIGPNVFYLSSEIVNFNSQQEIKINNINLTYQKPIHHFHLYTPNGAKFDDQWQTIFELIDEFLFAQNMVSWKFDLLNTPSDLYLIALVPAMFMNSKLQSYESVANFQDNLRRQANHDVAYLKLLASLMKIIETQFNFLSFQEATKKLNTKTDPILKVSQSTVKI